MTDALVRAGMPVDKIKVGPFGHAKLRQEGRVPNFVPLDTQCLKEVELGRKLVLRPPVEIGQRLECRPHVPEALCELP